jgi:hypothetical protein
MAGVLFHVGFACFWWTKDAFEWACDATDVASQASLMLYSHSRSLARTPSLAVICLLLIS